MRAVVLVALSALAVTVSAGQAPTAVAAGCNPGVRQVNGVLSRVFCGPAKGTVQLGGRTVRYAQGTCERRAAYVAVNIGIATLGQTSRPKPAYFGILVGRPPGGNMPPAAKDGTYKTGVTVAVVSGGKGVALVDASVTLQGGRTRGAFTARTLSGGTVTGSFAC